MFGAGVVLFVGGAISMLLGNGLNRQSGSDITAFIGFPFLFGGALAVTAGIISMAIGG